MNVKQVIYNDNSSIEEILTAFRLIDMNNNLEEEIKKAVENDLSYREFLKNLLDVERLGRRERIKNKNIKDAKFEKIVTLEEFDFKFQKSINSNQIQELATLKFIEKNENIILIGPNGVGKSHISSAIGLKACK